jgi:hypothetical protein
MRRRPCSDDDIIDQLASKAAVAISVRETRSSGGACDVVGMAFVGERAPRRRGAQISGARLENSNQGDIIGQ